jgi:hypothetical protein
MKDNQIGEGMARTRASNAMGKLTAEIKVRVDEVTKEELTRAAFEAGMGESEFIRELIMIRVRGFDYVIRVHKERMHMVAGIDPDEGC